MSIFYFSVLSLGTWVPYFVSRLVGLLHNLIGISCLLLLFGFFHSLKQFRWTDWSRFGPWVQTLEFRSEERYSAGKVLGGPSHRPHSGMRNTSPQNWDGRRSLRGDRAVTVREPESGRQTLSTPSLFFVVTSFGTTENRGRPSTVSRLEILKFSP